jgi:hypothetical protein
MIADLATTNTFLGVIAIAAVLEMAALLVVGIAAGILTRRIMRFIDSVEEKQMVPAASRVHAILDDVKEVTSTVRSGADWADRLSRRIFGR